MAAPAPLTIKTARHWLLLGNVAAYETPPDADWYDCLRGFPTADETRAFKRGWLAGKLCNRYYRKPAIGHIRRGA